MFQVISSKLTSKLGEEHGLRTTFYVSNFLVPESVILSEVGSTTSNITVSWSPPNVEVDYYLLNCPEAAGKMVPYSMNDIQETCQVSIPGDNYTVTVVSVSNGETSAPNSITITSGVLLEHFDIFRQNSH